MKYIGIVGSRRRNLQADHNLIERLLLEQYRESDRIVSGGCSTGADNFAEQLAKKWQILIMIHYARWNMLGKRAGLARNGDIAKDADVLIACVAEDRTGGTEDTIKKFQKLGKTDLILV